MGDKRPPTLLEVMLDPEFLPELQHGNNLLYRFLNVHKIQQIISFVI